MNKIRTMSWFLLLVILLVGVVSYSMAQENPTAPPEPQNFRQSSSLPETGGSLARSSVQSAMELTRDRHSIPLSTASLRVSPPTVAGASQEPRDPVGLSVLPLPDDLYVPLAPGTKASGPPVPAVFSASTEPRLDVSSRFAGVPEQVPVFSPSAVNGCQQLLGNPQLDVNEGAGTMLPWEILNPNIFFDKTIYTSAQYSLVLPDGDSGDPTPNQDAFGQAIAMPSNLNMVTITYYTFTVNTNSADYRRGELYTLDGFGAIKDYLGGWDDNAELEGTWVKHILTITDPAFLQASQGQDILLVLFNVTTNSAPNEVSFYDDITLDACYEDTGQIIVKKETDPNGAAQKFRFQASWLGNGAESYDFELSDGQSKQSAALAPGTYSVSELAQSGWDLTSATCDDGSNPGSISLQVGETVTCTFHNKKIIDAHIIVKKQTDPGGSQQRFRFQASWLGNGSESYDFELSDGQSKQSAALAPGTYSVSELAQSGWDLTSATCDDGSNPQSISLQAGETVTCTFHNKQEPLVESCNQLLVNSQLDVLEFGDGSGTVEPWTFIYQNVYYTNDPNLAYDGYSLVMVDGDDKDQTPDIDMMAQGFLMPANLNEISIEYQRATQSSNSVDKIYGELWLLDDDWSLHLDKASQYFVFGWEVTDSEATWVKQAGTFADKLDMDKMAGRKVAILLFTSTDGGGAMAEEVFFDDVKLTACYDEIVAGGKVLLPALMRKFGVLTGPICTPPTENPLDKFYTNRGFVQTNATCNSTLSNVDEFDYYAFKPDKGGQHTLHLTSLPKGTEWSAMIWTDAPKPQFAPGDAGDGTCRITQPGYDNKQVKCNLTKGADYVVKVSSGNTAVAGSYTMRITAP